MKKLLLSSTVLMGLAVSAMAADLPARKAPPAFAAAAPMFTWTGFYVGVNAGYGWLDGDTTPLCIDPAGAPMGAGCSIVPGTQADPDGFLGGAQAGFNYQMGSFVVGVEADIQAADIEGTTAVDGPFAVVGGGLSAAGTFTASQRIDWLGTARLRLGFTPFDRLLVYATGGVAFGGVELATNLAFATGINYPVSASDTRVGWTLGGGLEYALTNNLTFKIEGLYFDLDDERLLGPEATLATAFVRGAEIETSGGLVRAGVNFKF